MKSERLDKKIRGKRVRDSARNAQHAGKKKFGQYLKDKGGKSLNELSKQTIKSFAGKKAKKWVDADDRNKTDEANRHARGISLAIKKYPDAPNRGPITALKTAVRSLLKGQSKRKERRIDGANFKQFLTQAAK